MIPQKTISRLLFRYFYDCLRAKSPNASQQDLMAATEYEDPSVVSNWKHGRRLMLNAITIEQLIDHVGADRETVIGILRGRVPEEYETLVKLWSIRGILGEKKTKAARPDNSRHGELDRGDGDQSRASDR